MQALLNSWGSIQTKTDRVPGERSKNQEDDSKQGRKPPKRSAKTSCVACPC